jgi:hypothetical protein
LLRVVVTNFGRANLRHATDYRHLCDERLVELARLRAIAVERAVTITALQAAIQERQAILQAHGQKVTVAAISVPPMPVQEAVVPPDHSARLTDFFRPADPRLADAAWTLNQDIGKARAHCGTQLQIIQQLDSEARSLVERMTELK